MKICDECFGQVTYFVRRHKGKKYCRKCYSSQFKSTICKRCGEKARLPKFDKKAVCRKCERNAACIRCGRTGRPISQKNIYGVVCNSCYYYFQVDKNRHFPASSDLGTCKRCHRHRRLKEQLCNKCVSEDILCPYCKQLMPAGRGNICEECYWSRLFQKRLKINANMVKGTVFEKYWYEFGTWLYSQKSSNNSAILINRYIIFFYEMSCRWTDIPSYKELLIAFSASGLRKYQNIMIWLQDSKKVKVNEALKQYVVEKKRIDSYFKRLEENSTAFKYLSGYLSLLEKKMEKGNITIRSIRLALCPAFHFLSMSSFPIQQPHLERYLQQCKGQKSAISGFIRFINLNYELDLKMSWHKQSRRASKRKEFLESKLIQCYRECHDKEKNALLWVTLGLEYFHDIRIGLLKNNGPIQFTENKDYSYTVIFEGKEYWLPKLK